MEKKIADLVAGQQFKAAIAMVTKIIDKKGISSPTLSPIVADLLKDLAHRNKLLEAREMLCKWFRTASQTSSMLEAIGFDAAVEVLMNKQQFDTVALLVAECGLYDSIDYVRKLLDRFISENQYNSAFKLINNAPEGVVLMTREEFVDRMLQAQHFQQALKYIVDLKLDTSRFKLDVLVDELIKRRAIVDANSYIKLFGLAKPLPDGSESRFSERNLILRFLSVNEWLIAYQLLKNSPNAEILSRELSVTRLAEEMIVKCDWRALAKLLQIDNNYAQDGVVPAVLSILVSYKHYGQLLKFVLKYGYSQKHTMLSNEAKLAIQSSFPLDRVLVEAMSAGEFGFVHKYGEKYGLGDTIKKLQNQLSHFKLKALIEFRRFMRQKRVARKFFLKMRNKETQVSEDTITSLVGDTSRIEMDILKSEVPLSDDDLLVKSEEKFTFFVKESNSNLAAKRESGDAGKGQIQSFRLVAFLKEKEVEKEGMLRQARKPQEFSPSPGLNPNVAEFKPSVPMVAPEETSRLYKQDSFMNHRSFDDIPEFHPQTHRGSPPQQPQGMFADIKAAVDSARPPSMANSARTNVHPNNGYSGRPPPGMPNPMAQAQNSPPYFEGTNRREIEELNRRERLERLIDGLLKLYGEAQVVRRSLQDLERRHREATNLGDLAEQRRIHVEYQRLQEVQTRHKNQEKRVLLAARNDTEVYQAVQEFRRRKEQQVEFERNGDGFSQQRTPNPFDRNDQQARQMHRLRQHELEKQRDSDRQRLFEEQFKLRQIQKDRELEHLRQLNEARLASQRRELESQRAEIARMNAELRHRVERERDLEARMQSIQGRQPQRNYPSDPQFMFRNEFNGMSENNGRGGDMFDGSDGIGMLDFSSSMRESFHENTGNNGVGRQNGGAGGSGGGDDMPHMNGFH